MLLKSADNKSKRLALLEHLQRSPLLDSSQKTWLKEYLVRVKKGMEGERASAYYLDSYFKDSKNHVLLHDVRLIVDGETAQIDHLIINRAFGIYVIETKNYAGNLVINEHGEFAAEYGELKYGIPSPIEQGHRHERVLIKVLEQLQITGRMSTKPDFHHVVMLNTKATIRRPPVEAFDASSVIKADQFHTWHKKLISKSRFRTVLKAVLNLRSLDTIQAWGEKLAGQHRPADLLTLPKFLQPKSPAQLARTNPMTGLNSAPVKRHTSAANPLSTKPTGLTDQPKKLICSHCNTKITFAEGKFCWGNLARFKGQQYCREHQAMH
jgi:Nuclease-related domain